MFLVFRDIISGCFWIISELFRDVSGCFGIFGIFVRDVFGMVSGCFGMFRDFRDIFSGCFGMFSGCFFCAVSARQFGNLRGVSASLGIPAQGSCGFTNTLRRAVAASQQ
jgi:hypothetical protein